MNIAGWLWFFLFIGLGTPAYGQVRVDRAWPVMGTLFQVSAVAVDSATAEDAVVSARRCVFRVDTLMSTYRSDSEISQLNRAAGTGAWTVLSPETAHVLSAAALWARRSQGAFDFTVGPLMRVWGFHSGEPARPSEAARDSALALVGYRGLELDSGRARLVRKHMAVDLGAIAKGYALDLALSALAKAGAVAGMADLGGQVSVFGPSGDGHDGWMLGIRHPRRHEEVMGIVTLAAGSVATSGDYEQMFVADGVRYTHIMDARVGAPAHGTVQVTVAAQSGITADALSTLLFVLGSDKGRGFLARYFPHGGVSVAWVRDPGKDSVARRHVVIVANPSFADISCFPDSVSRSVR